MIVKIKHYLEKNSYPLGFVDKQIKFFLENTINEKRVTINAINNVVKHYKLPYIGHISTDAKSKIISFCKFYCKSLRIKIALTPFKVADMFNMKDPIPKFLKSFIVYEFFVEDVMPVTLVRPLAICQQGLRSIWKRIKSATFLQILLIMKLVLKLALSTENCFEIINSASTPFKLKLKEAMHIIWKKPSLNKQQKHVSISITV